MCQELATLLCQFYSNHLLLKCIQCSISINYIQLCRDQRIKSSKLLEIRSSRFHIRIENLKINYTNLYLFRGPDVDYPKLVLINQLQLSNLIPIKSHYLFIDFFIRTYPILKKIALILRLYIKFTFYNICQCYIPIEEEEKRKIKFRIQY